KYVDAVRNAPYINLIHIDAAIDTAAWKLVKTREDKTWSLVDSTSFIVMQQFGIQQALTTDHHFEQAGFIRLLKSE
ncbi:type II toxin-antitoxin system VapC family toxin, partial [Nodularia sp. UHCC 0506]|uniref:type II toxin-antitoxin system VapC family toxin n=1 Tax=Nodularia sp. UHCC 0506 TaxID=3110243 RepID=UPI002B3E23B6|nr:VapC toxin family PIN domain ribonuclease [Nodularia sp. UHCC 0506]